MSICAKRDSSDARDEIKLVPDGPEHDEVEPVTEVAASIPEVMVSVRRVC